MKLDHEKLVPHLADVLEPVTQGAREDLKAFVGEILKDRLEVMSWPAGAERTSALGQLDDQLRAVAEANRIRVEGAAWGLFKKILDSFLSAVLVAAKAAL